MVIDGGQNGSVVTMTGSEDAVLKGFTIQHGHTSGYGGGVSCNAGAILKNHIRYNYAASGGGGVYFGNYVGDCWIEDNKIEEDTSPRGGGGIFVQARNCSIRRDSIFNNYTVNRGGGIKLEYDLGQGESYSAAADTNITDNVIVSNHLTGSDPKGGGILSWDWPRAARRNVVRDNDSNGIYVYTHFVGGLDLGDADDPGFNVLMGNGRRDLVDTSAGQSSTRIHAIGNYWGYLHTDSVLARISSYTPNNVYYDPVAASSRWFDVDLEPLSTCSTSVLVTGDLRVMRSLTVVPGKTFEFYPNPDTSFSNANTELILMDSGTVLTSVGTAEKPIRYVLHPGPGAESWFGIRVHSYARAQFDWSEIKHAYNGILVERPSGRAVVADSKLDSCLFAGAYGEQGLLDVSSSDVSYNGVYGIYYVTHNDTVLHCGVSNCTLNYNGLAGVSINGPATSSILATSQVTGNLIDGGGMTSHGIEAADNASWTSIENNQVTACDQAGIVLTSSAPGLSTNQISGCNNAGIEIWSSSPNVGLNQVSGCGQAGIALHSSSPSLVSNTVQNNGSIGIVCLEGSNPYVRRNTVSQHNFGVSCDAGSYPDLGTANDSGNNIIDTTNIWWVDKKENSQNMDSVQARLNYWGVPDPSLYPGKFLGRVAYAPWLTEAPEGGGQQSAGVVAQPLVTSLGRVQPMPMRSTALIPFQVAHAGQVVLGIVDASGRVVRTLVRGERGAGRYNVSWNRADDHGRSVPAGVYFCTLSAENKRFCKKVVLTE